MITGTASGQGRAAALLFAPEGATAVGTDIDPAGAAETVELVRAAGGIMDGTHPLDLGDEDGVQSWIDAAAAAHGRIDVLYNNAGATRFSPIAQASYADWSFTLRNELDIVFLATKHAWPHPITRVGASVLLVDSTAGITGSITDTRITHTASKDGVLAMTKQLAAEGAAHGMRANCISPGMIATRPARAPCRDCSTRPESGLVSRRSAPCACQMTDAQRGLRQPVSRCLQ